MERSDGEGKNEGEGEGVGAAAIVLMGLRKTMSAVSSPSNHHHTPSPTQNNDRWLSKVLQGTAGVSDGAYVRVT